MTQWQDGFVQTNGIRMHYTRTGGAKVPVVLAHGFSDDGLCWTPVATALEADYDVVMIDARFHGLSGAPEGMVERRVMGDDLAGLITGLGLHQPIVLGHSMGAMTALMLAAYHPDLPRAILLEDPPARWEAGIAPRDEGAWKAQNQAWIAGLQAKSREAIIADKRKESPGWQEAELGPWADSKLRFNPKYLEQQERPDYDWPALLRRITCPVVLITGDNALGAIVNDQQAAAFAKHVPQMKRVHIPGAGHNIRRDQFEAYLAVIRPQFSEWAAGRKA
jgi:N-formylmaleamate deformylase